MSFIFCMYSGFRKHLNPVRGSNCDDSQVVATEGQREVEFSSDEPGCSASLHKVLLLLHKVALV